MAVHRQTVTDGITSETQTIISASRSCSELPEEMKAIRAIVAEHNLRCTFDGRVVELEHTCRRTAGVRGDGHQPRPAHGSQAWCAEEILFAMQVVRDALARGDSQLAASEAVVVGAMAAAAEAKFRWGDRLRRLARLTKNRELSQRSAKSRRVATAEQDTALDRLVPRDDPAVAIHENRAAGAVLPERTCERVPSAVGPAIRILGVRAKVSETRASRSRPHRRHLRGAVAPKHADSASGLPIAISSIVGTTYLRDRIQIGDFPDVRRSLEGSGRPTPNRIIGAADGMPHNQIGTARANLCACSLFLTRRSRSQRLTRSNGS